MKALIIERDKTLLLRQKRHGREQNFMLNTEFSCFTNVGQYDIVDMPKIL